MEKMTNAAKKAQELQIRRVTTGALSHLFDPRDGNTHAKRNDQTLVVDTSAIHLASHSCTINTGKCGMPGCIPVSTLVLLRCQLDSNNRISQLGV